MKQFRARIVVSLVVVVVACARNSVLPGSAPIPPDFRLFTTPRAFDGPGTVFRVAASGVCYPVGMVADLPVQPRDEAVAELAVNQSLGINALVAFLGLHVSSDRVQRHTVEMKLGQTERYRTFDIELFPMLQAFFTEHPPDSSQRYFVIRETISARSISFKVTAGDEANIGAVLSSADSIEAMGAGLSWDSDAEYQIRRDFDVPHNVFYKLEEVDWQTTRSAEPDLVLYEVANGVPVWSSAGQCRF